MSLRNDDNFRYDCARYCENIELGRHDEEWLSQAWTAHEKHKRGDFDEFLRDQFEENWGIKLPGNDEAGENESGKVKAGEPTQVDLGVTEPPQPDIKETSGKRKAQHPPRNAGSDKVTKKRTRDAAAEATVQPSSSHNDLDTTEQPPKSPRTDQIDSGQGQEEQETTASSIAVRSD